MNSSEAAVSSTAAAVPLSPAARVGRNSLFQISAQALGKLAALLLFLVVVRALSREDVGRFTFALAYAGVFGLLTDWGAGLWLVRQIARRRDAAHRWMRAALALRVLTFSASAAAALLLAWATRVPQETWPVLVILLCALLPEAFGQTINARLLGEERGGASATLLLLTDWLRLLLVLIALRADAVPGTALVRVAAAYFAATLLAGMAGWLILLKRDGFVNSADAHAPSREDVSALARSALPLLAVGLLVRIYLRGDTLLLGYLRGNAEVAAYNVAYKLVEAWLFVPAAFLGAVFPFLSRTHFSDAQSPVFQNACRQSVRMLSLLGLPLAAGTTILAPRIVDWLYGAAYAQSAVYLQILIWAVALIFWNATLPAALNATGHERDSLVVVAAGLAFNVAGNVLLIPRWGALAAAWMTLFTEIVSTLLYLYYFGRRLFPPQFFFLLARPVVAAAVMTAALAWIPTGALSAHPGLNVILLGLLGATLYAGVLLALGEIRRRDWQLWRDALGLGGKTALEPS